MNKLPNLLLFMISCLLAVLAGEGICRIFLNPVDYLQVKPVSDPVLNHKIASGAGGHDSWGFRNNAVPEHAEILAIGDSMTYGVMATSSNSWPSQLSRSTGISVYNASLGGYGPLHYLHLLRSKAPILKPDYAIVAIYLGNDFMDVHNLAYSNDRWKHYRRTEDSDTIDPDLLLEQPRRSKFLGGLRNWLAGNSILYRIVTQNPLFDAYRRRQELSLSPTSFEVIYRDRPVVLDPNHKLRFANLSDRRIVEAVEITEQTIQKMKEFCDEHQIKLQVILIPLKEEIYHEKISFNLKSKQKHEMFKLIENVNSLREKTIKILEDKDVKYFDLLDSMKLGIEAEYLYPVADGHPNSLGYSLIANQVASSVQGNNE